MGTADTARRNRLGQFRERVRALPGGRLAWRIGVTIVGVAVIVIGIILLPLPGPGWLIIFAGIGILGTEYEWAARLLRWARFHVTRWATWAARQPLWLRVVGGLLTLGVIAGIAVAGWFVTT
jgi:uncharacterized protein (TIGR02611 family)